jgi:hypothetical protein
MKDDMNPLHLEWEMGDLTQNFLTLNSSLVTTTATLTLVRQSFELSKTSTVNIRTLAP